MESHAYNGKWHVNCANMWCATLGNKLTLKNAILGHLTILLHEITHLCTDEPHKDSWDWFICENILNGKRDEIWQLESEETTK